MKSFFLLSFLLSMIIDPLSAQQRTDTLTTAFTKQYYLKTSKQQKNLATACVISGGALAVVGGFIWFISPISGIAGTADDVNRTKRTGITLTAVGAGLAAISIPLFDASKKNQRKAELYVGSNSFINSSGGAKNMLCIGTRFTLN